MTKRLWEYLGIAVIVLSLLVSVGVVLGQAPDPDGQAALSTTGQPATLPPAADQEREGLPGPAGAEIVLAQPPYTMNYQGYLTNGSGTPLEGTYDLTFSLYDAATGGTREWGPEAHNDVQVDRGLFQVVLGNWAALSPNDFDEALFLQVEVNGTTLTTRQPVRTVAYAFALVPGAEVEGDPQGNNYALWVKNTGTGSADSGLYAEGRNYGIHALGGQYGIYAEGTGTGSDVGVYSPDFVQAQGYKSNSDSYIWLPGMAGMSTTSADKEVNVSTDYTGAAVLTANTTGQKFFYIPVNTPAQLYGLEVRVEELMVYYYTTDSTSYINRTRVVKLIDAGSYVELINDTESRTSTSPASYLLTPISSSPYTLTASAGPLNVQLGFLFASTQHTICVGGIRLRLGHTD